MSKRNLALSAFLPLVFLTGCADIIDGTNQSLSVNTVSPAGDVSGASCQMNSNKGTWFVNTPGTVTVHRGYDALNIKCTKDGYQPAVQTAQSSTKGIVFGNVLAGGLIGLSVDMSTGAAYDYPNLITVMMHPDTTAITIPSAGSIVPAATPTTKPSK